MGERSELPPRLRNWKKGAPQVGAFLRTRDGATVTLVNDTANHDQETLIYALILGTQKAPPDVMRSLREWVDSQVKVR
jgi:hypothetical protein